MSTQTSPAQPNHIGSVYQQQSTPLTSTPTHMTSVAQHPDSAQSSRSFSGESASVNPELDSPSGPTGKNGSVIGDSKIKPHTCPVCQRGFTTGGHLQRHQRIHTGVKAFKCPFPGCETRTSRQDNLQQHYRTHLSPTLRRGSGSAARAAVAAAMEAAGIKSSSSRAPRKSKSSNVGTPSSGSAVSAVHTQSPYQTPTSQGPGPYAGYMFDPHPPGPYAPYPMPPAPGVQPPSGASSRVPSPVNGHSSGHSSVGSIPPAHHQQPYFSQPFSQPGYYQGGMHQSQQPYRYAPPGAMASPYGAHPNAHHGLYSPGIAPEHGQQHMYSPIQTGFPTHSREGSYGVMTPGYGGPNPMNGGYPPRTNTSTPISQSHDDGRHGPPDDGRGYPRPSHRGDMRAHSPSRRRLTPPHQADMIAAGVLDPAHMSTGRQIQPGVGQPYGAYQQPHHLQYSYGTPQQPPQHPGMGHGQPQSRQQGQLNHRESISSLSEDGSGGAGSDGSASKPMH